MNCKQNQLPLRMMIKHMNQYFSKSDMSKYTEIAIAYDFDGTLAPGNMQERSFLPALNINKQDFWREVKDMSEANNMNEILSYMHLMLKKANEKNQQITKQAFRDHGKDIEFFAGVEEYFDKINGYAKTKNIKVNHYVISSGLRDIIEGTSIYDKFTNVFASGYKYNVNGYAEWPAVAIDYTNKTQFLFRINKGINNSWDNSTINEFLAEEERPIPFSRMIYIGDGETDIPAMKMINYQGGTSIAVYNPNVRTKAGQKARQTCLKLIKQKRATHIAPADYTENSRLYNIIRLTIDAISAHAELSKFVKDKSRVKSLLH